MKKYQILLAFVILFLGIFSLQTMLQAAEIVYVKGRVQVQAASDDVWRDASKGMTVDIGDAIRTARNSSVEIALDAEKLNTIRIEEKAQVILNSASAGTIDRLDLAKGKVYSNLENIKAGLSFEVNTPSSVAGVRGSSYSVYVERDTDEISAFKDTVYLQAYDIDKNIVSDVMIPEGFKTLVDRFGEANVLVQISTREFERFDNVMEDLSARVEGRMSERTKAEEERKTQKAALEEGKTQVDQAIEQGEILDEVTDTQDATEDRNTIETIEDRHSEEH